MGEMADLYDEMLDREDEFDPALYFNLGPDELVRATAHARKPIIVSIRRQYAERGFISKKQQWALAYWCSDNDRRHA